MYVVTYNDRTFYVSIYTGVFDQKCYYTCMMRSATC